MKTMAVAIRRDSVLARFVWISFFALLTGAASWVRVPLPFTPVPITLQTMVVLASGILLGRDGVYAQVLYLLLGGVGLPMFVSSFAGFPALFGPTGGYLIGFVIAAWLTSSWLHPKWNHLSYFRRVISLCGISLAILVPGVLQLSLWMHLPISQAVALGFVPFVLGDFLKAFAVASLPGRSPR
jgi:biotin transport system substrate-specific component